MSTYRPHEGRGSAHSHRPRPARGRDDRYGRMYDDDEEHQRLDTRDHARRRSPSPRRRTPPQDTRTSPPRGPAADRERLDIAAAREWDRPPNRTVSHERSNYRRDGPKSTGRRPRNAYRDRDREGYRSPSDGSRSRSRSTDRRRGRSPQFGGPPSRDIILEGLPVEMTEDDLRHRDWPLGHLGGKQILNELRQYHDVEGLEDVRVIRDRSTGVSRQFGFLHFSSLSNSRAYLERNYPNIFLYGARGANEDGEAAKIHIDFGKERDTRARSEKAESEWQCEACYLLNFPYRQQCHRCQAPKPEFPFQPVPYKNTGDSDVSPDATPSQFLLLRGLEASVTEELLAKGVAKLYRPSGESQATSAPQKKAGSKVVSTTSDTNLGAKEGSIRRVLLIRDRKTNDSWRYGFAEFAGVEDAQAALTKYNSLDRFTIASKPVLVTYIHAGVFVPVLNHGPNLEKFTFIPLANPAMKLAYWDEGAYVTELEVSKAESEVVPKPNDTSKGVATAAAAAEKEGLADGKSKKRKADSGTAALANKKAVPAHLQFWRNRHAELHGVDSGDAEKESSPESMMAPTKRSPKTQESSAPPSQSYADLERKCCYLCSRQFKTEAEVNKHERLSQLHRDNIHNDELRNKALAKLAKKKSSRAQEYRDRAKERRAVYNQPKKPAPTSQPAAAEAPPAEKEDTPPPQSKGASLLGKMGWTAGEGLGAQGTGMTAPIATDMYVQGVGLGAQGGKVGDAVDEASRNTKGGYSDFLAKTKDKAKERYERMG
ncbi:MAG: hypothetical protein M1819_003682 [Sarea resinae]|nr:MAG: hypothetical protein M1819_003682 [Sarea resinae]